MTRYLVLLIGALVACGAGAQTKKPPAGSTEQDLRVKASKIKEPKFCLMLGRLLRKPDISERGQLWEKVVMERATKELGVPSRDIGYIRDRSLRVGMDWCSMYAAIGAPDRHNRTVNAHGESYQLIYSSPKRYVYLDDNKVRSWQD